MTPHRHASVLFAVGLLGALLGGGCGGGGGEEAVPAKGRVTNAGQPLHVEGVDVGLGMVEIGFYRLGPDGKQSEAPETAVADKDGYFSARSRSGSGIPPGKYRISVRQWDPYPQVDKLGGKFDEKNSPIIREITGEESIVIDLSKPQG